MLMKRNKTFLCVPTEEKLVTLNQIKIPAQMSRPAIFGNRRWQTVRTQELRYLALRTSACIGWKALLGYPATKGAL